MTNTYSIRENPVTLEKKQRRRTVVPDRHGGRLDVDKGPSDVPAPDDPGWGWTCRVVGY